MSQEIRRKDLQNAEGTGQRLPGWLEEVNRDYLAHAAHMFLLYFNVSDFVYLPGRGKMSLREFLTYRLRLRFDVILFYCQSAGITYPDEISPMEEVLKRYGLPSLDFLAGEEIDAPTLSGVSESTRKTVEQFDRRGVRSQGGQFRDPKVVFPNFERLLMREKGTAIIIDYVDKLVPAGTVDKETILLIETLQRWAASYEIRRNGNVVFLITGNLGVVHPDIHSGYGCKAVQLKRPDEALRIRFLQFLMEESDRPEAPETQDGHAFQVPLAPGTTLEGLAKITAGFSLKDLDYVFNTARAKRLALSYDFIKEKKKEILEAEAGGLLEVIEPRHGFEAIGGLEEAVGRIREKVEDTRRYFEHQGDPKGGKQGDGGRWSPIVLVPKGILLAGPPGTGKTILAEAFARESTMNLVKMRDIRSMWVGESERNLSKVMDILLSLAPVVVFVDEIDQALGSTRGSGSQCDGVSQRMFGKILEFMGDERNRGKVIWIGATNRPDLLDSAHKDRFDEVIPILAPDEEDRERIFRVMERSLGVKYEEVDLCEVAQRTEGLTGREIARIVRRASEYSKSGKICQGELERAMEDYKPNHDPLVYELWSLLAIQDTNSYCLLPSGLKGPLAEVVEEARRARSNRPIRDMIVSLKQKIGGEYA